MLNQNRNVTFKYVLDLNLNVKYLNVKFKYKCWI